MAKGNAKVRYNLMAKVYTVIGDVSRVGKSSLTGVLKSERDDLGMITDIDKMASLNG